MFAMPRYWAYYVIGDWCVLDGDGDVVGGPVASEQEAVSGVLQMFAEEPSASRRLCPLIVCVTDSGGRRVPVSAFYPSNVQLPPAVREALAHGDVIVVRHPDGIMEVWGP